MKVSIVTLTSNDDGNVEVSVMPFSTFEHAAKYLHSEYLDIKAENGDLSYTNDYVQNITVDSCEEFYLEDEAANYWCSGAIYSMEVK